MILLAVRRPFPVVSAAALRDCALYHNWVPIVHKEHKPQELD